MKSLIPANRVIYGLFIVILSGCASDRALIGTKTNVGIDIDTKPPTADITIGRKEFAVLPTFVNTTSENALPLATAFKLEGNFFNPKISQHFAGGAAAIDLVGGNSKENNSLTTLCLEDNDKIYSEYKAQESKKGEPRRFFFFTSTSFGLKASWSGTEGPIPDSFKLGYNRKEFASPPIFVNKGCGATDPDKYSVRMPSFYAKVRNEVKLNQFLNSTINHRQAFATGSAATEIAKRKAIQQVFREDSADDATEIEMGALNKDLIEEMAGIYNNGKITEKQKKEILNKAIEIDLVDKNTTEKELITELEKYKKIPDYRVSTRLNKLRVFIINSKES